MPRRAATITQADVARVLRAVRETGGGVVEVRPDGTITIRSEEPTPTPPSQSGRARDIVL